MLSEQPRVFCDTGHNEAGVREVLKQIAKTPHQQLYLVWGMVSDKDVSKVLSLLPKDAQYYFCKAQLPRALDAKMLQEKALENGLKGKAYTSVRKALKAAKKAAQTNDLVVVGGSTFVVAEVV
jgi:dihydrofolate synthase/folylpolyglutamate synthase